MAADTLKIGFAGTFSGPAAAGNDMRDGFNLGLEHLGRGMAESRPNPPDSNRKTIPDEAHDSKHTARRSKTAPFGRGKPGPGGP